MDARAKELMLLLIYLTGWQEDSRRIPGEKVFRSWKGYDFVILNEMDNENLVRQYPKTVTLTKEGISRAEYLKQKYLKTE
jgi:hypothetical protein